MTIRFLHDTPLEKIDQLCREEEKVEVMINTYHTEYYSNGTNELVQTGGFGGTIKSSKDLIQFDNEDMKVLTQKTKKELR